MIKPEMIPDEVVEAAVKASYEYHFRHSCKKWPEDCYEKERQGWRVSHRAAIAAALSAWPGAEINQRICSRGTEYIVLPLPQEKSDE